jgi:hypothetical protein
MCSEAFRRRVRSWCLPPASVRQGDSAARRAAEPVLALVRLVAHKAARLDRDDRDTELPGPYARASRSQHKAVEHGGVLLVPHDGAQRALLNAHPDRWSVRGDHHRKVPTLSLLREGRRWCSGFGDLREVQLAAGQDEEGHGVPLVDRLDLTRLTDEALLVGVLDADHVPVAVQPVGGEAGLLGPEHPAGVAGPVPEVGLQPPRHRIGDATPPHPPHDLVEHRLVRLCCHVTTSPSLERRRDGMGLVGSDLRSGESSCPERARQPR